MVFIPPCTSTQRAREGAAGLRSPLLRVTQDDPTLNGRVKGKGGTPKGSTDGYSEIVLPCHLRQVASKDVSAPWGVQAYTSETLGVRQAKDFSPYLAKHYKGFPGQKRRVGITVSHKRWLNYSWQSVSSCIIKCTVEHFVKIIKSHILALKIQYEVSSN